MKLRPHCEMLSKQYLLGTQIPWNLTLVSFGLLITLNNKDCFKKICIIVKTLPVIWKLFISDIPLEIAAATAVIGNGCFLNILGIFGVLSVIRVLTYKQYAWFLNFDERIISRTVFWTILLLWLVFSAPLKVYKLLHEQDLSEYICYLTSRLCKRKSKITRHIPTTVAILLFSALSFLNEIYIGIKAGIEGW